MSLILGIRCSDGVVLAAAGRSGGEPGLNGSMAARQRARPLRIISGQAVLGVSGNAGLAQELSLALEEALASPDRGESTELTFRARLRDALAAPMQRAAAIHRTLAGLPGLGDSAGPYAHSHTLVGLPFRRALRLYAQGSDCVLTEVTEEVPWAAVGPASAAVEAFLYMLRRILWTGDVPSTRRAELAACWALLFAGGDDVTSLERIQLVVMSRSSDGSIQISERDRESLAGIGQYIEEAERSFGDALRGGTSETGASAPARDERPVRKRVPEVRLTLERPDARRGFSPG